METTHFALELQRTHLTLNGIYTYQGEILTLELFFSLIDTMKRMIAHAEQTSTNYCSY